MNHEFWYLSRAAGFTAYLLLFVSVALGIGIGTRIADRLVRRNTIFDLHRFTTLIALLFTLLHVYVLLGDGYFHFNVWQLSLPFLSPYRGWQTTVGVISLYLLVIVLASFYLRQFIGYRAWRTIHFLTFALYAGATLHGISAGTDTSQPWARALYVVSGAIVVSLIIYRVQYRVPQSPSVRTLRVAGGVATVTVAAVLLFATGLLSRASATASGTRTQSQDGVGSAGHPFLSSFVGDFNGTFTQSRDSQASRLTLDGTSTGDLNAKVHVELVQTLDTDNDGDAGRDSDGDGDSQVQRNLVRVTDSSTDAPLCSGQLTTLRGNDIRFVCDGTGPYAGVTMTVATSVRTSNDGSFSGPMNGSMSRS